MTLYCPKCGYNLTGLPGNRCPECGEEFDLAQLRRMARSGSRPISLGEVLLRFLWPPGLLAVSPWIGAVDDTIGVWFMGAAALNLFIYGIFNADYLSGRLLANKLREGAPINRSHRFSTTFGLYISQWVVGLGGCFCNGVVAVNYGWIRIAG